MKLKKNTLLLLFSLLTLYSCANLFEQKINLNANLTHSNLSNIVVPIPRVEQLEQPQQIFVSENEFSNKIIISWSSVKGAISYRLEKAISTTKDSMGNFIVPDESEYSVVPLAAKIYSTQYTETILKNPSFSSPEYNYAFFYRVSAENSRQNSTPSEFTYSSAATLLSPASNVIASRGEFTDKIITKWNKVEGALSYDIYRSTNSDGSSSIKIGQVSSNQNWYTNIIEETDQGKDFYYSIVAQTNKTSSISSSIALGYALKEGAPQKVNNVRVVNGRGTQTDGISIAWDAASGSNIKYAIYRTSSIDSSFTLLKQGETGTTYTDKSSLQENIYYYYQVQSYTENENGEKSKGPFSDSGKTNDNPAEGFIISTPLNIELIQNYSEPTTCQIKFSASIGSIDYANDSKVSTDYNNYTYNLYYSDSLDGQYSLLSSYSDSTLPKGENCYYITNVETKKFFKMSTSLGSVESKQSNPIAPAPFAARNLSATKAEYIQGYTNDDSYANTLGVFAVKLSWLPPEENDAEGGYNIYRSTNPNKGFKQINEEPVMSTTFIDTNETAKAGVYYYYKVLSLNILSQGNNYSNTDYGYGALTAAQFMREYNKTAINSQKKLTLMHKANDMDKLGSESAKGDISGTLSYNASIAGLGADIKMHYTNYADFYINNDPQNGPYFLINGDTNTSASMDASGNMYGTVICEGMYQGEVIYDDIKIKGGAAGGGTYGIKRKDFEGIIQVNWKVGEEGR